MISTSNIILILIIGLILLFLYYTINNNNPDPLIQEKFIPDDTPVQKCILKYNKKKLDPKEIIDDVVSWNSSKTVDSSNIIKEVINPNLVDIQFHNDYRDVITAINNLVPEKKQRFNLANVPLKYSEPNAEEVKLLISDFIKLLNENLRTIVPEFRNKNSGWDECIPDENIKSGWDKAQEALGLPVSLYEDPAKKSPVKLITINYIQKYETEDEIKYTINLVIQKIIVEDQMLIRASFVQDKRSLQDENNFFATKNIDMRVIIEDIFIMGYLSKDGTDARLIYDNDNEKFYDYNKLENNNLTDPKQVQKVLMDKYKQRTEEMQLRNAMLDEEGQAFHKNLPNLYDFSNIKATRTIFDDMNKKKIFT